MTEDRVTGYLDAVARELPPGWRFRDRVLADLRLHIESAMEAGAGEEEALSRLGAPAVVAASLLDDYAPVPAPLSRRIAAFLLDVGIGWAVVWAGVGALTGGGVVPEWVGIGWLIAAAILAVAYFPAFEATRGRTPGKMLTGLYVVRTDGHPIGWKEALLRRLPLFFEFFLLDALFAPFTDRRQRAFDMVAGTMVIRSDAGDDDHLILAWLLGILLWGAPLVYLALRRDLL